MSTTEQAKPKPPTRVRAQVVVGSVTESERTTSDGTAYWATRAQYYSPADGSRIGKTFSSLTYGTRRKARAAADDWLGAERKAMAAGTWVDPRRPAAPDLSRITVAEVAEQWASTWQRRKLGAKTIEGYRNLLDGRVLPYWGSKRVGDITSQQVNVWVDGLCDEAPRPGNHKVKTGTKLHPTTIKRSYAVLRSVLKQAVVLGYIERNPANRDAIVLPSARHHAKVGMAMTWSDLRKLNDGLPEHWRTPVALTLLTGLRASELWGLTRADWNPDQGTIRVAQTLAYVGGKHQAAPAKTEASQRTLGVPEDLHAAITALATGPGVMRKGGKSTPADQRGYPAIARDASDEPQLVYVQDPDDPRRLLFTTPTGQVVKHADFYRRTFRPTVTSLFPVDHKLHRFRFHDLRHSHGTNVLYATNNAVEVMKRLGHSQIGITVNLYGRHADEAQDKLLTARIGEAWDGKDELAAKRAEKAVA
jgi:integrase